MLVALHAIVTTHYDKRTNFSRSRPRNPTWVAKIAGFRVVPRVLVYGVQNLGRSLN